MLDVVYLVDIYATLHSQPLIGDIQAFTYTIRARSFNQPITQTAQIMNVANLHGCR